MFTRSKSKLTQAVEHAPAPAPQHAESSSAADDDRARSARSGSSRSSATIKAQKAAAEALALRRRLEREQELASRELARQRELATLQQQVEDRELQAELAAIDAEAASSRAGSFLSGKESVERTRQWVEKQKLREPGCSVPPPAATRATLFPPTSLKEQQLKVNASEAVGHMAPLVSTEPDPPTVLLQAVADTAAAAKALASAAGVKKLELPQFFGNAMQWLQFKRIFDYTKIHFSALDNITRLDNALRGPAREAVAALLMSTEDPDEVMRALEENFARPELIVFREVNNLKTLPKLGNELRELGILTNKSPALLEPVTCTHSSTTEVPLHL
ncbi:uncharacterized protein LOC126367921 [Pectinophora gossypiella]|uniref:uncharacterized protein LOC126367921 n=1 Tax=Pectinophora gossypiella TaxID=13191 RepID=UPI00214EA2F9|nr:uncharacterized protein LOC126367921 [Pectinophora gossypiella]